MRLTLLCTWLFGRRAAQSSRRGTIAIFVAILLPTVLAVAAFVINIAYIELSRTESQIIIDVASRAAGRVYSVTNDRQAAIDAARRLMDANHLARGKLSLDAANIQFGVSTRTSEFHRYTFNEGPSPNAVALRANGNVKLPMLFPTVAIPSHFRTMKNGISTRAEVDIALVIDRSGSMAFNESEKAGHQRPSYASPTWTFGQPVPPRSRWLAAVDAVNAFIRVVQDSPQSERLSLVTFHGISFIDVPLTENYSLVSRSLLSHSNSYWGGGTDIGGAIYNGYSALADRRTAKPWAARVLIVLSDGIHSLGIDPITAAKDAYSEYVTVYTVTFSDEADQRSMQQVAEAGHGKHYHARNAQELVQAFEDIAKRLPNLITE